MRTVDGILYAEGQKPPNLPTALLVHFNVYIGPPFLPSQPKCTPLTFQWHNAGFHPGFYSWGGGGGSDGLKVMLA